MKHSQKQKLKVLVIIPAYNEQGKVSRVILKTKPFANQIIVIDDGSIDATAEEARAAGALVIQHPYNRGVGAAIRSGIDYAIQHHFEVCIPLGADDQDEPQEIPRLLEKIYEGYDFVQGSRHSRGGKLENAPLFRYITTFFYSLFFRILTGFPVTDGSNGFRAFRTDLCKDQNLRLWQEWLNRYELEPYLFYKAIKLKYKVTQVPVTKRYWRIEGYTKMIPFIDWWRITKPLIYLTLRIRS